VRYPRFLSVLLLVVAAVGSADDTAAEDQEGLQEEADSTDAGSHGFLDPYYAEEETSEGCWASGCLSDGCWDLIDIPGLLTIIRVSHHSDPFRQNGVRTVLGDAGHPFGLRAALGVWTPAGEGGSGVCAHVNVLTPSIFGVEILYQRVEPAESSTFSILYVGAPARLAFNIPLQVTLGAQIAFPREEGEENLFGVGGGLTAELLFGDGGGASIDYRLVWVRGLPLHRGEARLSWFMLPGELWAGYGFLRNSIGEVVHGPSAGVGLLL